MNKQSFSYRGHGVSVTTKDGTAAIQIGKHKFTASCQGGPFNWWTCPEAYGMHDSVEAVARCLVDHLDIITGDGFCKQPCQ